MLFLGGDFDIQGRPVPDHVALRYNGSFFRYELSALVWDVKKQRYAPTSQGSSLLQQYAFFQTDSIEGLRIDTRAGDDQVYLNPGYTFPSTAEEYGFALQDIAMRADLANRVYVNGGPGNDDSSAVRGPIRSSVAREGM